MTDWISVKDRLPPLNKEVIVCRAGQKCSFTACRKDYGGEQHWTNAIWHDMPIWPIETDGDITHWMPLPEPPKEGNDKGKDSHSFFKCNYSDDINENGWCKYKECHCDGNGDCFAIVFPDKVEQVERKDICKKSSIFGNHYISLTLENLEVLNKGGVLAVLEQEYNIFIELCEHLKAEPPKEEQGR